MAIQAPSEVFDTSREAQRGRAKRPRRGSRAKLAQRFFEDLYEAWEEQGESVINRAFFYDPVASLQTVARLMPQKIEVSTPTDGMSDERLGELLEYAERMAALKAGTTIEQEPKPLIAHDNPEILHKQYYPFQPAKVLETKDIITAPHGSHGFNHEKPHRLDGAEEGGGGPDARMGGGGVKIEHTLDGRLDRDGQSGQSGPNTVAMNNDLDIATTNPPDLPYPVGKPKPLTDVEAEKANKRSLAKASRLVEEDIDPASLF